MPAPDAFSEDWRPIVDFEGLYEVSSLGRVRRMGKAHRAGRGRGGGAKIGRVLMQSIGKRDRYHRVQHYNRLVHLLVADAFQCACGCGRELVTPDAKGRDRRFLVGHSGRLRHVG